MNLAPSPGDAVLSGCHNSEMLQLSFQQTEDEGNHTNGRAETGKRGKKKERTALIFILEQESRMNLPWSHFLFLDML